ncbi:MAG: nucleotide pyrophosphohydrolase [Deltaproteobacteria bacterium]|nr:nucleotide pyrophosphohydrolase [Deltaproteobacteria bacterium]
MEKLRNEIDSFIATRNWQKFHSPKNLAMALTVETAELLEIFQWMTPEESSHPTPETLSHIEEEIGDVMIYLTTIATSFGLDPMDAAHKKLWLNEIKYPAEKSVVSPGKKTEPL